jgi:hypothetical protein
VCEACPTHRQHARSARPDGAENIERAIGLAARVPEARTAVVGVRRSDLSPHGVLREHDLIPLAPLTCIAVDQQDVLHIDERTRPDRRPERMKNARRAGELQDLGRLLSIWLVTVR